MDKTASSRPTIPRLQLPHVSSDISTCMEGEGLQLTTCRSDFSEFALPTSFRTARNRPDALEKLPNQLDKLTGIIETVMDNLKDSGESRDSTRHLPMSEIWGLCDREKTMMRLEEVTALAGKYKTERDQLEVELKQIQGKVDLMTEIQEIDVNSLISSQLEKMLTEAQFRGIKCDFVPASSLSALQHKLHEAESIHTILINELRLLKHHTENLTGQRLNSLDGNWEIEVPAFTRNLLSVISAGVGVKARSGIVQDIGKVKCSAENLHSIMQRVGEILDDWEQSGGSKEFAIQLGHLAVTIVVESQAIPELSPAFNHSLSHQIAYSGSQTDRLPEVPPPEIDAMTYIHQLEEKIVDLQSELQAKDDHPTSIPLETNSIINELETKLEEVVYKLTLANQQITRLKQGKYSMDEERLVQNYKMKLGEVRKQEEEVRDMGMKLAL